MAEITRGVLDLLGAVLTASLAGPHLLWRLGGVGPALAVVLVAVSGGALLGLLGAVAVKVARR